jgi:tetratricopeptide (TPR) repeat protein
MYEEESEQVVGSYAIYFAEGDNLAKKKEFKKAIDAFTKALEFQPDDRACLIARSKCYLQLGDANEALKDAETSLKEDSKFHGVS